MPAVESRVDMCNRLLLPVSANESEKRLRFINGILPSFSSVFLLGTRMTGETVADDGSQGICMDL
jgi:hypothetical protein